MDDVRNMIIGLGVGVGIAFAIPPFLWLFFYWVELWRFL